MGVCTYFRCLFVFVSCLGDKWDQEFPCRCCCCRDIAGEEWPLSLSLPDEILISAALIWFLSFSLQGIYCRWPENGMLSLKCKEKWVWFGGKTFSFLKHWLEYLLRSWYKCIYIYSIYCIYTVYTQLTQLLILYKDNLCKYRNKFLNDDFIY